MHKSDLKKREIKHQKAQKKFRASAETRMIDNWKVAKSTSDYLKSSDFFQRSKKWSNNRLSSHRQLSNKETSWHFFPFNSVLKMLNCKYPQNLLYICASVEKTTRRVYYACIGLQWSNNIMFYAEFIALPNPGIKDKKHLFQLSMNGKFKVKKPGTSPLRSLFHHCRGDRTRNAFWEICPPFCLFLTQTRLLFWLGHRQPNNYARSLICDYT